MVSDIEEKFGKTRVTRRNKHMFLGMNATFNKNSMVTIMMNKYLQEAIEDFGEDTVSVKISTAKNDIFAVDENSERLEKLKSDKLHIITAKLLYVSNRARLDINKIL